MVGHQEPGNVSLDVPIDRVSVDHRTAFDIGEFVLKPFRFAPPVSGRVVGQ
jgi:hypothetical protein